MTITVLVPTYRRSADLRRCLLALSAQTRPADQVLVTARPEDAESIGVLADFPRVAVVPVARAGVIAAMNAGLTVADGEILALTDDDGAPWPDWLAKIEDAFLAEASLGAIGGRDWQYKGSPPKLDDGAETRPGELQWWGRVIGQHHWAALGPARDVSVIKGVNSAYRTVALRQAGGFDERLAGTGAQVHWELSLCLSMKRHKWRVMFDPAIGVDHFPAQRFDEDQRIRFVAIAQQNATANETLVLLEHFKLLQRLIFISFAFLVGTRGTPGLLQVPRLVLTREPHVILRWIATAKGRCQGIAMFLRSRHVIASLPPPRA